MTTPDAVVARLLSTGPDAPARDEIDALACELLAMIRAGALVDVVRPLLSPQASAGTWRVGGFVLSELGDAALPVLDDAVALLAEDSKLIRYYVLDALHASASSHGATLDAGLIAAALPVLDDDEEALREKVMSLLVDVDASVLDAVPPLVADDLRDDVAWLVAASPDDVQGALAADDAGRRRCLAAVAAVRLAADWDDAWTALADSGVEELVGFGAAQKRIAGRLRRREALVTG